MCELCLRIARTLVFLACVSGATAVAAPTPTPTPNLTCSSQSVTVTRVSSPIFYLDSSSSLYGAYVGFSITNNSGAAISDLWVQLENFAGGVITLSDFEDGVSHIGALANGATTYGYFYLKATGATSTAQTFRVALYPSDPSVSSNICTENFSLTSQEALSSGNNTVSSVTFSPNPPELGGIMTVTVTGVTGTIGSAGIFAHTPAALTAWRADSFKLTSTQVSMTGGNTLTSSNSLYLSGLASSTTNYTATYSFRVIGALNTMTALYPIMYISSGAQIKHTSTGSYGTISPIAVPQSSAKIDSISFSPSSFSGSGGTTTVTVVFSNSGTAGARMDEMNVTLPTTPASVTYSSGSSTFGGSAISNPTLSSNILSWIGTFNIPAGGTASLTFNVVLPSTTGSYSFSAIGLISGVQVDTTAATSDNLPASGSVSVVPSPTPSPTTSPSPTLSPTPSPTLSPTASPTNSASPSPTMTPTPTASPTASPTTSPSPSDSPTPTPTETPTPSPSPTASETPDPTLSPSPTASETPDPTDSPSPTASETPEPTLSPSPTTSASPSPTASETPDPTLSPSPTAPETPDPTDSPSPTASETPEPTLSPSPTTSASPSPTPSETPDPTLSPSPTASETPDPTDSPSPTASETPEPTLSPSPTATAVEMPTEVPTPEETSEPTISPSPTASETPDPTLSPSPTASETPDPTNSPSPTASETPEPTLSPSPTTSASPSPTPSETPDPTLSPSPTASETPEPTLSPSPTTSPSPSASPTPTAPPPVVSPPTSGPIVNPNPPINGTGPANTEITVYIDGNPVGTTTTDGSGNWIFTPPQRLPSGRHTVTAYALTSNGHQSPVSNSAELEIRAEVPLDFDGDGITDITTGRVGPTSIRYDSVLSTTSQHRTETIFGTIPAPADYDGDGTWDYGALSLDNGSVSWKLKLSTTGLPVRFNHGKRGDSVLVGRRLITPYKYSAAYVRGDTVSARDFDSGSQLTRTLAALRRGPPIGCGDVTGDGLDELIFALGRPGSRTAGILAVGLDGNHRALRRHTPFPRAVVARQAGSGTPIVTAIYGGGSISRRTSLMGLGAPYDGPSLRLPGGNVDISSGIFIPGDHAVAGAFWTDGRMIKRRLLERGSVVENTITVPLGHSVIRPQRLYSKIFVARNQSPVVSLTAESEDQKSPKKLPAKVKAATASVKKTAAPKSHDKK